MTIVVGRSRFSLFDNYRRSYKHTRIDISTTRIVFENEIYAEINDSVGIEMNDFNNRNKGMDGEVKRWLERKESLDKFLEDIRNAIDRIKVEYANSTGIDWGNGNAKMSDHLLKQVTGMFTMAQGKIDELGMAVTSNKILGKLKKSVRQAMLARLARHADLLRSIQSDYNKRCMNTPKRTIHKEDDFDEVLLLEGSQRALLHERDSELDSVTMSLTQVVEVLRAMQTCVVEQGSVLDRIDYNLEQSQRYVGDGNVQLTKAHTKRTADNTMRKTVVLFLSILVFILLLAIFIK